MAGNDPVPYAIWYDPLWPNVTSLIKPEVHNISKLRQRRTEPLPQGICIQHFGKIGPMVPEICSQTVTLTDWHTDRLTDKPIAILRSPQYYSCILQIICVISEENKLLLPYPPYLKNVTALPCKMHNVFVFFIFCTYRIPMRYTDELRKRLVVTWVELQQSVVHDAVDQWQKRLEACIRAEGSHFEHLL